MRIELEIWRQDGPRARGFFESHVVEDAEPQMSLLELLDRLNDQIIEDGGEPEPGSQAHFEMRLREAMTDSTFTCTTSPSRTASSGCLMNLSQIWEICTKPS